MRIAIVSDIHGNRTALDAVLADLRVTSPDLIFHGGDLAGSGANSGDVVDQIRDLGWPGVVGNSDEMLFRPAALNEFANQCPPNLQAMFQAIEEMANWEREALGEGRLAWLRGLPRTQIYGDVALVHASPESLWKAPAQDATDSDLAATYSPLGQPVTIYAHIHHPYIRQVADTTIANTGSVSLSYDGDPRAAYLLLDILNGSHLNGSHAFSIRRVEYDIEKELQALSVCGLPHAGWIAKTLASARPQMP